MTHRALLVLVSTVVACAPPSEPTAGTGFSAVVPAPRPDPDLSACAGQAHGPAAPALALPAITMDALSLVHYPAPSSDARELQLSAALRMSIGEGAPRTVDVDLGKVLEPSCCCDFFGDVAATALDSGRCPIGVNAALTDDAHVRVTLTSVGEATLTVTGVVNRTDDGACAVYGDAAAIPFSLALTVTAEEPTWSPVRNWDAPANGAIGIVQSGAPLMIEIYAEDPLGSDFYPYFSPANLLQPPLTLSGSGVTFARTESGLMRDVIVSGAGAAHVAVGQTAFDLDVRSAADVDAMRATFALAGYGGGGAVLEDGATWDGFARTGDRIVAVVASVASGGETLGSGPRAQDFTLTSLTPDTCEVDDHLCDTVERPGGTMVGQSAHVLKDGVCHVRLTAPALNGGAGLSQDVSVTLLRTDSLIEMVPAR